LLNVTVFLVDLGHEETVTALFVK